MTPSIKLRLQLSKLHGWFAIHHNASLQKYFYSTKKKLVKLLISNCFKIS